MMSREKRMTYHIIKKSFGTEFCPWPDEIGLCVTERLQDQIERARNILKYNPDIQKLYIEPPLTITSKQSFFEMQDACRFEIQSIIVQGVSVSYFVQSKWSKTICAEYDLSHLVPHPVIEELQEESTALEADIREGLGTQDPSIFYEVQTLTASEGWINTWSVLDADNKSVPQTFKTRKAAQTEIDEQLSDIKEAIENGDLDVMLEEFRIVQISKP